MKDEVMAFKPVSGRICVIHLQGESSDVGITILHASMEKKTEIEKQLFYELVESEYCQITILKLSVATLMQKIRKMPFISQKQSLLVNIEKQMTIAKRTISFATEGSLVVKCVSIRISPGHQTINQINHLLIETKLLIQADK